MDVEEETVKTPKTGGINSYWRNAFRNASRALESSKINLSAKYPALSSYEMRWAKYIDWSKTHTKKSPNT